METERLTNTDHMTRSERQAYVGKLMKVLDANESTRPPRRIYVRRERKRALNER